MADETRGRRASRARSGDESSSPSAAVSSAVSSEVHSDAPAIELELPKALERDLSALEAVDDLGRLTLEQRRVYVGRVRQGVLQLLAEERTRLRGRGG